MDMSTIEEPLACGTDSSELLAQVAEGRADQRDDHQRHCPHCQATLAEYARLWAPFDELAAIEVHAPPGLVDRALATIRETAGPPGWGRVTDSEGSFLVAARAVVSVAGHAARTSRGVRVALSTLGELTAQDAAVEAGVSGQSVAVELTVAAEYGHDLHRLAEHLRDRVTAEVLAQTGLDVVEVDVTITDVFRPLGPA
jgi:uncharacterized alkaline shock family protein YloU